MICVSASAIVWGWERAVDWGGGCSPCPRGRPRLGWGGCWRRRGLDECRGRRVVSRGVWCGGRVPAAGPGPHSAQSLLPLSSPPRGAAVCITLGRLSVCLCVGRGIPGDVGGHCHTCPGGGGSTVSGSPPWVRLGSKWQDPRGDDREGLAAATPNLPGEGLSLAAPLFVVWGSAPPPLSLLAPRVSDWGWG